MATRAPSKRSLATLARAAIALLALGATSTARAADDEPTAVPYRPSVSTPAALSTPGWLEVEAGFLHEHDGAAARRDSLPVTLKLAFTPDWGVRIGADAWVRQKDDAARESGFGDTSIVLKRRFAIDDASAFGLEAGATAPTGRRGLGAGSGKADYGINAIYSADIGTWHTDINFATTRLGQVDPGAGRAQLLVAASLSKALDDRWGVVGEFSGTHQRGAENTSQFLVAASYNVTKRLVLDAGAARSLRSGAPSWSAFSGFTWLASQLF
ncbi:MAG: transporter [Caldimonas sp.]